MTERKTPIPRSSPLPPLSAPRPPRPRAEPPPLPSETPVRGSAPTLRRIQTASESVEQRAEPLRRVSELKLEHQADLGAVAAHISRGFQQQAADMATAIEKAVARALEQKAEEARELAEQNEKLKSQRARAVAALVGAFVGGAGASIFEAIAKHIP